MGKLSVVRSDERHDPARDALRSAIAERNAVQGRLTAIEAALPEAKESVWTAKGVYDRAVKALAQSKTAAAEHAVSTAIGEAGEVPLGVDLARRRLVEAEDALEVARAARDAMEKRLAEDTRSLDWKTAAVQRAAQAVLEQSPAVARAEMELEAAQRALMDKAQAFRWLIDRKMIATELRRSAQGFAQDLPKAITLNTRFNVAPSTWKELLYDRAIPGDKPFQAALASLMQNADAELPA